MQPVLDAENKLKSEVQQLQVLCMYLVHNMHVCNNYCVQDRLTRCAQKCEDEYRDSLPAGDVGKTGSKEMEKAERCLVDCCETHSKLIPKLIAKFKGSVKNCK